MAAPTAPADPTLERQATAPPEYSSEKPTTTGPPEMSFIQQEPPMAYQPQQPVQDHPTAPSNQPVHERGPRMITPRTQLRGVSADTDCPFCKKVVRTEVRQISTDDDGFMQCLICLVCWPMLFCYESNKDTDHHCGACHRKLTHQPHGGQTIDVTAQQMRPAMVPSEFEQR